MESIRDEYLRLQNGSHKAAAVRLAHDLTYGDPETHKQGYTPENATLAACGVFTDVNYVETLETLRGVIAGEVEYDGSMTEPRGRVQ